MEFSVEERSHRAGIPVDTVRYQWATVPLDPPPAPGAVAEGRLVPRLIGLVERCPREEVGAWRAGLLPLEPGLPPAAYLDLSPRGLAAAAVARGGLEMSTTPVSGTLHQAAFDHHHRLGSDLERQSLWGQINHAQPGSGAVPAR
ncbi:MAG: hypothetical protein ACYCV7_11145 [Acidimicrobiales bacterium]